MNRPTPPDDAPTQAARDRLAAWVEAYGGDHDDPVWSPQIHDDLRLVLGMPPEDRS